MPTCKGDSLPGQEIYKDLESRETKQKNLLVASDFQGVVVIHLFALISKFFTENTFSNTIKRIGCNLNVIF